MIVRRDKRVISLNPKKESRSPRPCNADAASSPARVVKRYRLFKLMGVKTLTDAIPADHKGEQEAGDPQTTKESRFQKSSINLAVQPKDFFHGNPLDS